MSIKGGQIVHAGNGITVIDRIQTGGPGQVNIPVENIYELGNYQSVGQIRDTPDLTFQCNSYDVSTEIEELLTGAASARTVADGAATATDSTVTSATAAFTSADVGRMLILAGAGAGGADLVTTISSVTDATTVVVADQPATAVSGASLTIAVDGIDLADATPVDIASQFEAGKDAADEFAVVGSIAVPFLNLQQMTYQFGLHDDAQQQAQLQGDTIFYNPGPTFVESTPGTGTAGQAVLTAHPAYQVSQADNRRVLAVTVAGRRLVFGVDYTETYGTVTNGAAVTTVTLTDAVATTDSVRIIYSSPDSLDYPQSVHPDSTVKPAAVRGRDIEIYAGGYNPNDRAGSAANKLVSVQSVTATWQVTLDKDEEFGNYYATGIDFDVPQVSGNVQIKPADAAALQSLLRKVSGITDATKVLGTSTSVAIALDIVIKNPDTGRPCKRIHCPDARFTPPGVSGQVQQKTQVTLPFTSDGGVLQVFAA